MALGYEFPNVPAITPTALCSNHGEVPHRHWRRESSVSINVIFLRSGWGGSEHRVHATIPPREAGHGRRAAADEFGDLALVTAILFSGRERNLTRDFVSRAPSSRIERRCRRRGRSRGSISPPRARVSIRITHRPPDWFGIEHVALLANVDLGLKMRHLEMIITLLQHSPKGHVWIVAVLGEVQRRHAEWVSLQLEGSLVPVKRFPSECIDFGDLLIGHGVAPPR